MIRFPRKTTSEFGTFRGSREYHLRRCPYQLSGDRVGSAGIGAAMRCESACDCCGSGHSTTWCRLSQADRHNVASGIVLPDFPAYQAFSQTHQMIGGQNEKLVFLGRILCKVLNAIVALGLHPSLPSQVEQNLT